MSLSISFSRTISPETACETLITVARSRSSAGAKIVLVWRRYRPSFFRCGYRWSSCAHLAISPPTLIAIPGFEQVRICDLVETTCRVEACGNLVGDRLIVNKAVCLRRADGLFIKVFGIDHAAFYSCDLRAAQCGAVFKILRAMLRPNFQLLLVSG